MNFIKDKLYIILYPLFSIIIGAFLLISIYAIPTDNINNNISDSIELLWNEMDYPNQTPNYMNTIRDNYTDAIMLNIVSYDRDGSLLLNAFSNPFLSEKDTASSVQSLADKYLKDNSKFTRIQYSRYWHGYMLTLKPLLYFFNLSQIRIMNSFAQLFLFFYATLLLYKRFDFKMSFAFFMTIAFINPVVIAYSFQLSTIYYLLLLSVIFAITFENKLNKNNNWLKLFLILGILIAYFDFLTYPLVPLGVLLALYVLMHNEELNKSIINIIKHSIIFSYSYLLMWISKWIISSIIIKENVLKDGFEQIGLRTTFKLDNINIFSGLENNFALTFNGTTLLALLFTISIFLYLLLAKKYTLKLNISKTLSLLLISLMPVVWYLVTPNHSFVHNWMTYRVIGITVFALICILSVNITNKEQKY